jgi:hypothetical protein
MKYNKEELRPPGALQIYLTIYAYVSQPEVSFSHPSFCGMIPGTGDMSVNREMVVICTLQSPPEVYHIFTNVMGGREFGSGSEYGL